MPFVATFEDVAVSAAQDLFELVAPAGKRVHIYEVTLGQYSDAGDAMAELLSLKMIRGHTTAGSGGSTLTPANLNGASARSAEATVKANNTSVASGGSPATVRAEAWNIQGPYFMNSDSHFVLEAGQRFVVRVSAPADAISVNGTIIWEEKEGG
jgi:hypothetical protein